MLQTLSHTLKKTQNLLKLLTIFQLPKYHIIKTIKKLTPTNTSTTKIKKKILFIINTKPSLNSTKIY